MNIFKLPYPIPALKNTDNIDPCIIYERLNHYKTTLPGVRFKNKVIMSGTSGIGKKSFLYYYIARSVNAHRTSEFGPFPVDSYGSRVSSKVIVLRDDQEYTFYFVDEKMAYSYSSDSEYQLINCFLPEKTLYLYSNPHPTLNSAQRTDLVANLVVRCPCPILVVVDMNLFHPILYSGIVHGSGVRRTRLEIVTLWLLRDLIDVAAYHNSQLPSSRRQNSDQLVAQVTQRYRLVGGIIKCIPPPLGTDDMEAIRQQIDSVVDKKVDFRLLWNVSNKYLYYQNAFFFQYIIHRTIIPNYSTGSADSEARYLHHHSSTLSSLYVQLKVYSAYLTRYSVEDLAQSLLVIQRYVDSREAGPFWDIKLLNMLLQLYVSRLISTVDGSKGWSSRRNRVNPSSLLKLEPFGLHMPVRRGSVPPFAQMAHDTLYVPYPGDALLPTNVLLFKRLNSATGQDQLHAIAVDLFSESNLELTLRPLMALYAAVGLDPVTSGVKLHYYHCPLINAERCTLKLIHTRANLFLSSLSIIHLPSIIDLEPAEAPEDPEEEGQNYDQSGDGGSSRGGRMKKWHER